MKKYCFGIDVGGTSVKCGLFSAEGDVLDKWEIPTRTEDNGVNILPDVADAINRKIEEKKLDKEEIAGIGIGVPGPVNENGEVPCAVNLHWGYVNIAGDMERLTGLPVKAGNDANVAALGELWKGGGAGYHSLIMVTLGTGVGGGSLSMIRLSPVLTAQAARSDMRTSRMRSRIPATAETADAWNRWLLRPASSVWQKKSCRPRKSSLF